MNLTHSLVWMFVGSILIGVYLNPMNILAYRFSDLYFSSKTLIYGALFMASNMCILEVLMFNSHMGKFKNISCLVLFAVLSVILVFMLREQIFIGDEDWLKRMISHHSTALTTSHKIIGRTQNPGVKKLAGEIIETQEIEIKMMKELLMEKPPDI